MNRRLLAALATVALLAAPLATAASAGRPGPPRFAVTVFRGAGGEPNVSVSPNGRIVLVDGLGGGGPNQPADLFRSIDGGRHFVNIRPYFQHVGGGDWDMRWLDDHTVIAVDLSLGTGIYIHRSTDGGLHWTDAVISEDVYDRPWLTTFGSRLVYVVTKGFDGIPYLYTSHDGGQSFGPVPVPIYGDGVVPAEAGGTSPTPVEALVTNQNAYVDHVATDPRTGQLYVLYGIDGPETYSAANPVGVPDRLYVAVLAPGLAGGHFVSHPVYVGGSGDGFIDGFNWLTVAPNGTLYVLGNGLHAGHQSAWLWVSTDHALHWSRPADLGLAGGNNVYAAIAATSVRGTLGLVYLHGPASGPNTAQPWSAEAGYVVHADSAHPVVAVVRPLPLPVHLLDICMSGILCGVPGFGNNRNLLDYIWTAVGPDGRGFSAVSSDGPATGSNGNRVDVVLFRQTSGPLLGAGVPD
ncbi:MAG TPA: hypothetical protein VNG13_11210 [Mycobacteriales bacterium]|nr:hypothetical protein [Mycobacteriales bacterium]